jgi:two-component system chemotaxis response regulator CheB
MPQIQQQREQYGGSPDGRLCPNTPFDVVAIAASAGGLPAIRQILVALPPEFPVAILVQTHQSPEYPSILAEVLGWRSNLPVVWAAHQERLRAGCVTVAPPGQHVRVAPSGVLSLTSWKQMGRVKPHADGLFTSVASSFTTRAIGVVLTGFLSDGAQGARAVKQHGGRVLVQDPATAEAPDMPRATISSGCADFVLPLPALAAALTALVMVPGAAEFFAVRSSRTAQPYRDALRMWAA